LAFPSGTATAHLISVLHQLPPPDTSVRRREAYHNDDEEYSQNRSMAPEAPITEETQEQDMTEREVVEHQGWHNLLWSFAVSGFLTVSFMFCIYVMKRDKSLFSCLPTFIPSFSQSPSSVIIWHETGYGILHQVCHMLAKVRYSILRMSLYFNQVIKVSSWDSRPL
jgi:hypothetical protein